MGRSHSEAKAKEARGNSIWAPIYADPNEEKPYLADLRKSQMRAAYQFYGRSKNGEWRANWIPPNISAIIENNLPKNLRFKKREGGLEIFDFDQLPIKEWQQVVHAVFNADLAGQDIQIRKNTTFWSDNPHSKDTWIDDQLFPESRNGVAVNYEWKSKKILHSLEELEAFNRYLYERLNLVPSNSDEREKFLSGPSSHHINGVVDLSGMNPADRLLYGKLLVAHWGDQNDSLSLDHDRARLECNYAN